LNLRPTRYTSAIRWSILPSFLLAAAALLSACGGDSDSDAPASLQPTVVVSQPTAAQPTAAATVRPVVVTQAMFASIGIDTNEVTGLFGSTPFMQQRTNVTDINMAFSSSPELSQFLTSQQVSGSYNAWTATGPCTVCAVQVPVMAFPNENAATMAYDRVRQVNQMIFQNVQQAPGFSSYWNSSFCQNGTFATAAGQTLNWMFCAARKGNAVITVAVGGFSFNQMQVGDGVRRYATRAETFLKTQFP
jgi:hypothetical protein